MNDLEVGQVLSLKIKFNNSPGTISSSKHPYLIVKVDSKYIELAQFDSDKKFKSFYKSNKLVLCTDPDETVIDEDSFVQMDNKYIVDNYDELTKYRRQKDKLSKDKLEDVLNEYNTYQSTNVVDDNKIVYLSEAELEHINR